MKQTFPSRSGPASQALVAPKKMRKKMKKNEEKNLKKALKKSNMEQTFPSRSGPASQALVAALKWFHTCKNKIVNSQTHHYWNIARIANAVQCFLSQIITDFDKSVRIWLKFGGVINQI